MEFLLWCLVNLAVPLLAPIAFVLMLKASSSNQDISDDIVFNVLKDGAMFWTVIAMSCSAMFEVGAAIVKGDLDGGKLALAVVSLIWHLLMIVFSSLLVMLGTIDMLRAAKARRVTGVNDGKKHTIMFWASIAMAIATALSFGATHYVYT